MDEARTKSSSKRDTEFHTPSCEAKHSPDDVVMLIKQHMRDKHLSQEPMVVLSSERAPPLSGPEQKMPRNPLSEKIVSEYLKTAKHVEQPPWTLKHAASYLREFCDRNQKGEQGEPPHFVFSSIMVAAAQGAVAGMELPIEYSEFATGAPKIVQVVEKPPEGLRKKPCAKAKAKCKVFSKPKAASKPKAKGTSKAVPVPSTAKAKPAPKPTPKPKAVGKRKAPGPPVPPQATLTTW